MSSLGHFIQKLQAADAGAKRRVVWGGSAITMTVIVGLWLLYMSASLQTVSPAADEENGHSQYTFWDAIRAGSAVLWQKISSYAGRENSMVIERQEFTFTPKDTPAPEPRPLPVAPQKR